MVYRFFCLWFGLQLKLSQTYRVKVNRYPNQTISLILTLNIQCRILGFGLALRVTVLGVPATTEFQRSLWSSWSQWGSAACASTERLRDGSEYSTEFSEWPSRKMCQKTVTWKSLVVHTHMGHHNTNLTHVISYKTKAHSSIIHYIQEYDFLNQNVCSQIPYKVVWTPIVIWV